MVARRYSFSPIVDVTSTFKLFFSFSSAIGMLTIIMADTTALKRTVIVKINCPFCPAKLASGSVFLNTMLKKIANTEPTIAEKFLTNNLNFIFSSTAKFPKFNLLTVFPFNQLRKRVFQSRLV